MRTNELSESVRLLNQLLEDASLLGEEHPNAGPVILMHQNVPAHRVADVRFVNSDNSYYPGKPENCDMVRGDAYIKILLDQGYEISTMAISRGASSVTTTKHIVMTVLVKLKDDKPN